MLARRQYGRARQSGYWLDVAELWFARLNYDGYAEQNMYMTLLLAVEAGEI